MAKAGLRAEHLLLMLLKNDIQLLVRWRSVVFEEVVAKRLQSHHLLVPFLSLFALDLGVDVVLGGEKRIFDRDFIDSLVRYVPLILYFTILK